MRALALAVGLLVLAAGVAVWFVAADPGVDGLDGVAGSGAGAPVRSPIRDDALDRPAIDSQVVFLYYEDLDEASAFYESTLGLEKTYDANGARIYRTSPTSYVGLVAQGSGYHDVADEKPVMVSLVSDDVDAWYDKLVAAGAEILSQPADSERAPVRAFLARDPGGYTVEFFAWQDR